MQSTPRWGKGPERMERLDCSQWLGDREACVTQTEGGDEAERQTVTVVTEGHGLSTEGSGQDRESVGSCEAVCSSVWLAPALCLLTVPAAVPLVARPVLFLLVVFFSSSSSSPPFIGN